MVGISPLADFEKEPWDSADMTSMWQGALGGIQESDLSENLLFVKSGSDFSDAPSGPQPGQLYWHKSEAVMYCWHDVVDDTGVSLWLACGPDKFEVAVLTQEAIKAASPLELTYDRIVKEATPHTTEMPRVMGFNQSGINNPVTINDGPTYGGDTAASGTWIRAGVDGLIYGKQDYASSHPTQAAVRITESTPITLEWGSEPMGIVDGPGGFHDQTYQSIGLSTQWTEQGGAAVTEPSYIFKFIFSPRVMGSSEFS